jgi:uncharacterized membrane protein YhaH (DUF805 family)
VGQVWKPHEGAFSQMFTRNPPDRDDRALQSPARVNRQTYWAVLAGGVAATMALQALGFRSNLGVLSVLMVMLQTRRAHDFGGDGWWAAVHPALVLCLLTRPEEATLSRALLALAIVGVAALFGAIPGDAGLNRFGPPISPGPMFRRARA